MLSRLPKSVDDPTRSHQREESRQDSRWGFTSHRMTLMVCQRCRYVLHFYDEPSIFNFD